MIEKYDKVLIKELNGAKYSPNHRIKTIMAVHKTSSIAMPEFKFE